MAECQGKTKSGILKMESEIIGDAQTIIPGTDSWLVIAKVLDIVL